MKKIGLTFLLGSFLSLFSLLAQLTGDTLKIRATLLEEDDWNRLYIVDNHNQLLRYNDSLKLQAKYANKRPGIFSSIDVSNPFRILLFSEDNQSGILLDNALNELLHFSTLSWGYQRIGALAISNDNNLWALDQTNNKLLKINIEGKVIAQSNPLIPDLEAPFEPIKLLERQNQVFLFLKNKGVAIFDNFGMFQSFLPLEDLENGDWKNGVLLLKSKNKDWTFLQLKSWKHYPAPFDMPDKTNLYWGSKVYVVEKDAILFFPYKK